MSGRVWSHEQFDEMSWHDNHVHGLRVVEGAYGAGELILDLDYIEEWLCDEDRRCTFRIVPVTLRFLDVTHLRIAIDYATPTAGLTPFAIHALEREFVQRERYLAQVWRLDLSWPDGEIVFEASGFEQRAVAEPVHSEAQCLSPAERGPRSTFTRTGLILYVERYPECVTFYQDVLALPVLFENAELTCFDLGSSYLMVEPAPAGESPARNGSPATCLRLNVPAVAPLAARLRERGVDVDYQEHDWGTVARFRDPDGNLCAFKDDATFESQVAAGDD